MELANTTITTGSGGGGIVVTINGGGGSSQSGGGSPSTVTIFLPYLTFHAGNSLAQACVAVREITMTNSYAAQLELNTAQTLWARYSTLYARCTPTAVAAPPPPSPSSVASSQWEQRFLHLLPTPTFSIPPGFGVVNLPSYLVTTGERTVTFSDATAIGTLSITATSTYSVSVDGGKSFQGPYLEGEPWPIGGVTLQWHKPMETHVTLLQNWIAHWSLDGQGGSFPTVVTQTSQSFKVISLTALHLQALP
jgi:hypothetical protein